MRWVSLCVMAVLAACLVEGCGSSNAPSPGAAPAASQAPRAAEPPASPAPAASAKAVSQVGDLFPPGAGRDQVLNTCGSCHPVACTARGQRTAAQWDRIEVSHKDNVAGLSDADRKLLFSYLKANFNDTKPEPVIPAEFLQQGCTPF